MPGRTLLTVAICFVTLCLLALLAGLTTATVSYVHALLLVVLGPVVALAWVIRLVADQTDEAPFDPAWESAWANQANEQVRRRGGPLRGRWSGTLRVRPVCEDGEISVLAVRLSFYGRPLQVSLSPTVFVESGHGVTAVELLEIDAANRRLDLRFVVVNGHTPQSHVAQLVWQNGTLVSEDDNAACVLELLPDDKRRRRKAIRASRAARRRQGRRSAA